MSVNCECACCAGAGILAEGGMDPIDGCLCDQYPPEDRCACAFCLACVSCFRSTGLFHDAKKQR